MLLRVNKTTGSRRQTVKYAALSTGTISHVWYDEDSAPVTKRTNRIRVTRQKPATVPQHDA